MTMENNDELTQEQTKLLRKRFIWIVISVMFAAFMSKLDVYIVNISLPGIARYFNTSVDVVSRIVIVYLLAGTSTLLFFGKLGDRFGQKKIFISGYALFTLGSLMCGLSSGINMLVFFRLIQGLGGAMLISAAYAIVPKIIPKEINGWAFGIMSMGAALGIAVGAPVGGLIVQYFSWHWIFFINAPIGAIAIILAVKMLPSGEETIKFRGGIKDYDIPGTILSFIGISMLMYAINIGHKAGWKSGIVLSLLAASIIILTAFYFWEKLTSAPLFDFGIYKDAKFLNTNISAFFALALLGGSSFMMPFYLEYSRGLKSLYAGIILMSYSVVYIFVSPATGRASDKIQPPLLSALGMSSSATASIVFSFLLGLNGTIISIIFLIWMGISFAFFFSPNNNYVMSLPSADKKGVASGSYNALITIGTALGVAVFETVFSMSLPSHQGSIATNIASNPGFREGINSAFGHAYLAGGLLCIFAAVFSAVNISRKKHMPSNG
jgi:EmrB/QacA subfamily drug resistance transporter